MTAETWLFIDVLIAMVAAVVIWYFFGGKCSGCGRIRAIYKTGKEKKRGGFFQKSNLQEWKCKYCGHRMWRDKISSVGLGGGPG